MTTRPGIRGFAAPSPLRLVIVGAGGHGREALDVVEAMRERSGPIDVVGFVGDLADDELLARRGTTHLGPLARLLALLAEPATDETTPVSYHLAIGAGHARERLDHEIGAADPAWRDRAVPLVHPLASLGSDLSAGPGAYLAAGARLTTNITLGRHVQVNVNAVVSHDCVVGDYVTLSPGALVNGNATLGDRVFLGTGAVVLPGRSVGAGAVIGAGAVVTRDVPPGVTAAGVPARW